MKNGGIIVTFKITLKPVFRGVVIDEIAHAYREDVVEVVFKKVAEIVSEIFVDVVNVTLVGDRIVAVQERQLAARGEPPGVGEIDIPGIKIRILVEIVRRTGQCSVIFKLLEFEVFGIGPIVSRGEVNGHFVVDRNFCFERIQVRITVSFGKNNIIAIKVDPAFVVVVVCVRKTVNQ